MNPNVFVEFANEIIKISGLLGADKSFVEGLTPKQVHIVMEIGTNSYRHGQLAGNLGVEPSTLTRTLEPLVKAGIVDRQQNPVNRREVLICLSEKGETVLQEIHNKMSLFSADIWKHVPDDQLDQVESSLTLLLKIMKQLQSHQKDNGHTKEPTVL